MERITCRKCGRERAETEFIKMRDGTRYDVCKDCLCQYIDNKDPSTFLWILELFDIPYIESEWLSRCKKQLEKKGTLTPRSIIGMYIRDMLNFKQYKSYRYADSDKLNFTLQKKEKTEEEVAAQEEELLTQLNEGEISPTQYKTLTTTNLFTLGDIKQEGIAEEEEDSIAAELTDEDKKYLTLKWGSLYRPAQWVKMETLYQKYAAEFELNADREEVLKKICKASLKMDECLDVGDLSGAKNLSAMLDQLRKSGKFTEAQNKEDKKQELDSIGELVKLCEAHAGPIRPEVDPYDTPQDKIDFTIRDIQSYLYNLVTKEHGLGNLIESYIQKLEKKEQLEAEEAEKNSLMDSFVTSREEEAKKNAPLSDEEAEEFQQAMMQMREEDAIQAEAEELVNYFGGK